MRGILEDFASGYLIHIGSGGNNGNDGKTYANRKLTFADNGGDGAITACPAGGTILIWPDTYDEAVVATKPVTLYAVLRGECKIYPSSGNGKALSINADGCSVYNLDCQGGANAGDYGLYALSRKNLLIDNCYVHNNADDVAASALLIQGCEEVLLRDSRFYAQSRYAVYATGNIGCRAENCIFDSQARYDDTVSAFYGDGWELKDCYIRLNTGPGSHNAGLNDRAVVEATGDLLFVDCMLVGTIDNLNDDGDLYGVKCTTANASLLLRGCVMGIKITAAGAAGDCYGISCNASGLRMQISDGSFVSSTAGAGSAYSIAQAGGAIIRTANLNYDPSINSGTVYDNFDANGRIDVGKFLGTAVELQGNYPKGDVVTVAGSTPETAATIIAALMAKTGITAGGTWTYEKAMKVIIAWTAGKWQDKSGSPGVYEILDPDDGSTVIAEITPSKTTPQKQVTIL